MSLASNLKDFIKDSGIPYKSIGQSWVFKCPRCFKEDKVYIRKWDARFICWYCASKDGYTGKGEYALADLTGQEVSDIQYILYGGERVNLNIDFSLEFDAPESEQILRVYFWPYNFYPIDHNFSRKGSDYLEGRGIPQSIALEYDIRYCPANQTVAFPIKNGEVLLGWQERLVIPHEYELDGELIKRNKSKTAPGVQRDQLLMFSNRITSDYAVLAEGPVDALAAHLCGGNVAAMGIVICDAQMNVLKYAGVKTVYMGTDPDMRQSADRLVRKWCLDFTFKDMIPERNDLGKILQVSGMSAVYKMWQNAPLYDQNRLVLPEL